MTQTGLELFMEDLKQFIYSNHNSFINNHPSLLSKRPQIQQLYEELGSMIQILFVDQESDLHELEQVRDLKNRFKDAVEEAQDMVDLFVSAVNFRNNRRSSRYNPFESYMNLARVTRSIKSIKVEFITIKDNKKTDSSGTTNCLKKKHDVATGTSSTRNWFENKRVSEEIVVGFDHDAAVIRDKLVEDLKKLYVISIVGMGGLGKTTMARKVFNDPFVVYHFHVRAWVTVSQTYQKRDLLIQILASIGVQQDLEKPSDSKLRETLHKGLMGRRYLIVIDDIWSNDAWDDIKLFFPNDNIGSRILLTSRLTEVASHSKLHGFVHHLKYLTKEESWELLRKKVFQGEKCPEWLIEPGMKIAKSCHGLPLAVVVIAGVVAKEAPRKYLWERIARSVSSYIVRDRNGYAGTLSLSYDHLPRHLKDCFLYLAGFPEDYKFRVRKLIWLWMAEGFVQEAGCRNLEEIAEDYVMDLIDRNLLVVASRKSDGGIKSFSVHDLLREFCLEKATEERFFLKKNPSRPLEVIAQRYVFTNTDINIMGSSYLPIPSSIRSLVSFQRGTSSIYQERYFYPLALLKVLDLQTFNLILFPPGIELLVHLRYLAIWCRNDFPSSICNLWKLQTLVFKSSFGSKKLPRAISNLVNLRHLWCDGIIRWPSIEKPTNLQTISYVCSGDGNGNLLKYFPGIKNLACSLCSHDDFDFESLSYLETLTLKKYDSPSFSFEENHIRFPTTLKKLTLVGCGLPWSDMSIIQSLPNLEVLKLQANAFVGPRWDTGEEPFPRLKFLKLKMLDIQQWEASNVNFPRLERLMLEECHKLEEIPLGIGDILSLERIESRFMRHSVVKSLDRIREDQHDIGNDDLKIHVYYKIF